MLKSCLVCVCVCVPSRVHGMCVCARARVYIVVHVCVYMCVYVCVHLLCTCVGVCFVEGPKEQQNTV